jgi:hypothetical protein
MRRMERNSQVLHGLCHVIFMSTLEMRMLVAECRSQITAFGEQAPVVGSQMGLEYMDVWLLIGNVLVMLKPLNEPVVRVFCHL